MIWQWVIFWSVEKLSDCLPFDNSNMWLDDLQIFEWLTDETNYQQEEEKMQADMDFHALL